MARRGENIYKRGDGRWEGRYIRGRTPEGRAQYGYVYAATYSVCREKRRQRLRELPREITPSNIHTSTWTASTCAATGAESTKMLLFWWQSP